MRRTLLLLAFIVITLVPAVSQRRGWLTVYNESQQMVEVTVSGHCSKRLDPNSNHTFELPMGDYQLTGISPEGKRVYATRWLSDSSPYTQWSITDWELGR